MYIRPTEAASIEAFRFAMDYSACEQFINALDALRVAVMCRGADGVLAILNASELGLRGDDGNLILEAETLDFWCKTFDLLKAQDQHERTHNASAKQKKTSVD